jgi:UDPglucose 6-dehydrogenase
MKICVVGTGYVGLVAGAGFADMGHEVVCCDVDDDKVTRLRAGEMPFYEPGLDALVRQNAAAGRLTFTTDVAGGARGAEAIFLAVGTPPCADGSADLSFIFQAAETAARALTGWAVIVTKSTVPVGTGDQIEALVRRCTRHEVAVASNPEFLKEGDAVNDFMKPDRIVIGTVDKRAIETLKALYAPFTRATDLMLVMDRRSAELTKYAANAMLATRISFMNDLAGLCDALSADIELVRRGMGADLRIGNKFLYAGAGFGGSCFPKDLRAVVMTGRQAGVPLPILDAVVSVNERQKRLLGDRIVEHFDHKGSGLSGRRIAVWGLAFKPGTDDLREAPALVVIERLRAAGAHVVATDPQAMPAARRLLGDAIEFAPSAQECARDADAVVLMTEWHEYRRPNFAALKRIMRPRPVVFDGRNQWDPAALRAAGFTYFGIGRGTWNGRALVDADSVRAAS